MQLNTRITAVEDGLLTLTVQEIPSLKLQAASFEEIPEVVSNAAAEVLGQAAEDFIAEVSY